MSLGKLIFICAIVVFVLLCIFFPEFRSLVTGWTRLFIKDMATTPDGAEAIYQQKINEAQEAYNRADDGYKKAAGRLRTESNKLIDLQKRLKRIEGECEALVRSGDMESARVKSEERSAILSDISRSEQLVQAYKTAATQAEEAYNGCQVRLEKLRREKKEVVENMRTKQQLKEIYDDMDDLKAITGTDKMLEEIRQKSGDLDSLVEGARVVHESKNSTKVQRAEEAARKVQSDDYLAQLQKKYHK